MWYRLELSEQPYLNNWLYQNVTLNSPHPPFPWLSFTGGSQHFWLISVQLQVQLWGRVYGSPCSKTSLVTGRIKCFGNPLQGAEASEGSAAGAQPQGLRGFGWIWAAGTGGSPVMVHGCMSFLQRAGQAPMQCILLNLLQRGKIQLFQLIKQTSPCFLSALDGRFIN